MKDKQHSQRKKEDRVVLTDSSGATKSEREDIFNTSRLEMDTHADNSRLEKQCQWKEIMMKPENKNKYECLDCDGYDRKCSGHPDYIPNRFWRVK